jgi:hypothetical protein
LSVHIVYLVEVAACHVLTYIVAVCSYFSLNKETAKRFYHFAGSLKKWSGCFMNHLLAILDVTSWVLCSVGFHAWQPFFCLQSGRTFRVLPVLHLQCFNITASYVDATSSDMVASSDVQELEAFKQQILCNLWLLILWKCCVISVMWSICCSWCEQ